jgi:Tol biopolymer transport system component
MKMLITLLLSVLCLSGCDTSWSPDGKKILFTTAHDFFAEALYLVNSDGTEGRKITSFPEKVACPSFMSDTKICYISAQVDPKSYPTAHTYTITIAVRDLNSNEKKDLVTLFANVKDRSLFQQLAMFMSCAPSPDGKWILYESIELKKDRSGAGPIPGVPSLWLLNTASGKATRMTEKGEKPLCPVWAPDSKRFAYCAPFDPKEMFAAADGEPSAQRPVELWVMDLEGSR